MSTKDFILRVQTVLAAWAASYGGHAVIAGDVVDVFDRLKDTPGTVRAVIWITGEDKRGEHEETGVVDRKLMIYISRGKGFTLEPSDTLVAETAGAGKPLYDMVEEARDVLRATSFPQDTTEATMDYLGFQPFALPTEQPVDAYQLEFSIGIQLPAAVAVLGIGVSGRRLALNMAGALIRLN